jgi:hypothetical protein
MKLSYFSERPLLDLIDGRGDMLPITEVRYDKRDSNFDRFRKFHAANPHVYRLLVKFSRLIKSRGFQQFGIARIYEHLRWTYDLETKGDEQGFRLNNNWRSFYARLIMAHERDLEGFFETRATPHDSTIPQQQEASL